VVMEATSDYWRPVFYLLEAQGFEVWLVNARDVKHLPGRPKTDRLDAVWLAKLAERGMLRPSFVPPPAIRRLRDPGPLPRRPGGGADRGEPAGGAGCRVDAQIKLSVVAADSFGVSGRAMLAALVAGERDPKRLAQLAAAGCVPSAASWRRPSVAISATITGSCWPGCLAVSTRPAPTSPSWRPTSRPRSPLICAETPVNGDRLTA
jgi:Transposase